MQTEKKYFPLFMDLTKKKILVWGAGRIAVPRIRNLVRYGAKVFAIAPQVAPELLEIQRGNPEHLVIEEKTFSSSDLDRSEADYAMAATNDPGVNEEIVRHCRKRGIPVNNISDRNQSDFFFSALIEEEDMTAGVISTKGDHRGLKKAAHSMRKLIRQEMKGGSYLVVEIKGMEKRVRNENRLVHLLEEQGNTVSRILSGEIECISQKIQKQNLQKLDWIIFTSRNGVLGFFQNLLENKLDIRSLYGVRIAAIGAATEERLKESGIFVDFLPSEYNSRVFAEEFKGMLQEKTKVLYVQNEAEKHPLTSALKDCCDWRELPVYRNREASECRLISEEELLSFSRIYFTNAGSIERTLGERTETFYKKLNEQESCYVIGPSCKKALNELGIINVKMADEAAYESLAKL